ncbi:hypothetical protein EAG_06563 [Camponotus floridanus]|uniref:Uncharacterized protein n=1 Tax=Camponotus floridanus TaxID=104421 RepID=E2AMI7_CAMFO|nr:hypothetical protein EAG_06563 [Camponotus floridanus]
MSNSEDILRAHLDETADSEARASTPIPPLEPEQSPQSRPSRMGIVIQRSDHTINEKKRQMLLTQPSPAPARRQPRPYERPPSKQEKPPTSEEILRPMGPMPIPPIKVEVEPGLVFEVPHFAVHVSRRYKPRTPQGRWILRFSGNGKLRYHRKIE